MCKSNDKDKLIVLAVIMSGLTGKQYRVDAYEMGSITHYDTNGLPESFYNIGLAEKIIDQRIRDTKHAFDLWDEYQAKYMPKDDCLDKGTQLSKRKHLRGASRAIERGI